MIDASETERTAMRQCLRPLGNAAGRIGLQKRLGEYSELEALQVIDAIVSAFTEAMALHHEATQHPPMRRTALSEHPVPVDSEAFHDDPIPF